VKIGAVAEAAPPGDLFDRKTGQGQQFPGGFQPVITQQRAESPAEYPMDPVRRPGRTQVQQFRSLGEADVPVELLFQQPFDLFPFPERQHRSFFFRQQADEPGQHFAVDPEMVQTARQMRQVLGKTPNLRSGGNRRFQQFVFFFRRFGSCKRSGKKTAGKTVGKVHGENPFDQSAGTFFQQEFDLAGQTFLHHAGVKGDALSFDIFPFPLPGGAEWIQVIRRHQIMRQSSGIVMQAQTAMELFFKSGGALFEPDAVVHPENPPYY